jgi:hypothetical protein
MNTGYLQIPVGLKPEIMQLYDIFMSHGHVDNRNVIKREAYTDIYLKHPDFTIEESEPVYSLIFDKYYDGYNHITYISRLVAMQTHTDKPANDTLSKEFLIIKDYDKDHFVTTENTVEMSEEEFFKEQSLQKEQNNG